MPALNPQSNLPAQGLAPEAAPAREKREAATPEQGNWFHRNRWFTKEPITYTGYQFFRSAMATIPYGIGMATVHRLMGWLKVTGEKKGLTASHQNAGIASFDALIEKRAGLEAEIAKDATKATALNKELAPVVKQIEEAAVAGRGAQMWRNASRFAGSPINQALQIGASFTMFRFVGGLIKGQRDKVMNETNTAADTNRESKNWVSNITDMAKTNWMAESTGTPVAALTLGFASANFKPIASAVAQKQTINGVTETFGQAYKRAVLSPQGKLVQNAAIWTIAYSIFFEAAERIFKDMQLKRGKWLGNANSLKNTPDDVIVGGYAPDGYAADGHTREFHQINPPKPKLEIMTGDPSICRFLFRRVLPVSVGITGYALMKRGGYIAAGGPMQVVTHEIIDSGFKANAKAFWTDAKREGIATGTFGILWIATDAWGSWYDKFFANMQDKSQHHELTPHQSAKLGELHEKLQQKEMSNGRVA